MINCNGERVRRAPIRITNQDNKKDVYRGFADGLINKKTKKMFLKARSLSPRRLLKKPKRLVVNALKTIEKHVQLSSNSFKKSKKKAKTLLKISTSFNLAESNFLSSGGSTFYNAGTSQTKRSFMNSKRSKKFAINSF